ncbi:MAG: autotransporter assembly complex family protein [Gammaproteobacteria bacterium]|jgi:translocation and assembly module TamA
MSRFLIFMLLLTGLAAVQAAPSVTVKLDGLDREQQKNVLAYLTIEQERKADDLTAERIRRYYNRAPREINEALQPYGYYQPLIKSSLEQDEDKWVARYEIDPGPPVIIDEVDLHLEGAGKDDATILRIADSLPVEVGERLVHADYEKAKALLRTAAVETGYREARYLKSEVRVEQANNQAVVVLHLDTGDKAYFGRVRFEGGNISDELLSRYIPFKTGDVWSSKQLLALQRGLVDSGYFLSVNIVPQPVLDDTNQVPINVILTPYKLQKYSFGLGYSTNLGIQGSVNWLHRRINHHGHRLSAGTSVSPVRQDANATYSIPLSRPRTDVLEISGIYRNEDTVDVKSEISELRVSRNFARGSNWREVLSLGYKHEVDDLADGAGISNLLIPKGTWTLVKADNRMLSTEGFRIDLETSGSAKNLLSDVTFLQGIVTGKIVRGLGKEGRFIMRAEAGATAAGNFDDLPASNRFFTGGDNTVRGYEYKSLAPANEDGDLIGGKYLLVGSIEYDYNVYKKWYLATFYDIGNAFNDASSINASSGAGVGIRWASPVGMVRVDVATALSEDGHPWRLHITFGPDF